MIKTAVRTKPMLTFALLSIPESAGIARCHVRAALDYNGLRYCAEDAAAVTSELVANAVQHAPTEETAMIVVRLVRVNDPAAMAVVATSPPVVVIVADSSPHPPVKRDPLEGEGWRGLHIVEALTDCWGWTPFDTGKAVFAVLPKQGPSARKESLR